MADLGDPVRLFDPRSEASDELRALFQSAQQDLPSAARLAAIQAKLPRPAVAGGGPAAATPSAGKLLLTAVGIGLVGAGVWFFSRSEPPPAPTLQAPSPSVAPLAAPAASEAPVREPSPATSPTAPASAKPAPAPPVSRSANEAALLERARRALASDPNLALSLARRHEKEFPSGNLRQEREVIAIEALRRLGRSNEATRRADDFQHQFPNSAHGRSVERGLGK
jgi:hypothetical protein